MAIKDGMITATLKSYDSDVRSDVVSSYNISQVFTKANTTVYCYDDTDLFTLDEKKSSLTECKEGQSLSCFTPISNGTLLYALEDTASKNTEICSDSDQEDWKIIISSERIVQM